MDVCVRYVLNRTAYILITFQHHLFPFKFDFFDSMWWSTKHLHTHILVDGLHFCLSVFDSWPFTHTVTPLHTDYRLCRRVHHMQWGSSHTSIRCTAPRTSLHSCSACHSCCSGPGSLDSPPESPLLSPPGQRSLHLSSEPACSPGNPSDHSRHLKQQRYED